jgi:hypothetical protein
MYNSAAESIRGLGDFKSTLLKDHIIRSTVFKSGRRTLKN